MKKIKNILKYIDVFGTKYYFFIDKKRKYYSILGGIFSFISFILCFGIFALLGIKKLNPSITTIIMFNSTNKFEKNKIWIPWRISDDKNYSINYSNITIYYINNEQNNINLLNYKLCNETPMFNINKLNNKNFIDSSLKGLFCIDLGEIFNNNYFFIPDNIIFNLYLYNKNNLNSLKLELFFPKLEFDSNNFLEPLYNIYRNHYIYLKENIIKKEKIILGEYSVYDKYGFLGTKEKLFSLWGTNYFYGENININNNNNSLPIYSLNISLDIKKIQYKRYHTNVFSIFIEEFPICYIIFKFIKCILKSFILAESNSKIIESLFEKINLKDNKYDLKVNKVRFKSLGAFQLQNINNNTSNINDNINKSITGIGKIEHKKNKENKNNRKDNNLKKIENNNLNNNLNKKDDNNLNKSDNENDINELKILQKNSEKNIPILKLNKVVRKKSRLSINMGDNYSTSQKKNNLFLINQNILINKNDNKDNSFQLDYSNHGFIQSCKLPHSISPSHKYRKKKILKLFPFNYYFFSTFLKSFDIMNCNCLFSLKYKKVFTFFSQVLDLNTYILLRKEFEIMKNIYCSKEDLSLIENKKKININNTKFNREIKDCIDNNKFHIFFHRAK